MCVCVCVCVCVCIMTMYRQWREGWERCMTVYMKDTAWTLPMVSVEARNSRSSSQRVLYILLTSDWKKTKNKKKKKQLRTPSSYEHLRWFTYTNYQGNFSLLWLTATAWTTGTYCNLLKYFFLSIKTCHNFCQRICNFWQGCCNFIGLPLVRWWWIGWSCPVRRASVTLFSLVGRVTLWRQNPSSFIPGTIWVMWIMGHGI